MTTLWKGHVLTESPQPIRTEHSKQVLKSGSQQQADKTKSSQQKVHQNNRNQFLTLWWSYLIA